MPTLVPLEAPVETFIKYWHRTAVNILAVPRVLVYLVVLFSYSGTEDPAWANRRSHHDIRTAIVFVLAKLTVIRRRKLRTGGNIRA